MSAALNGRADTSAQSAGTVPDLSLSSLTSAFSTPGRALRVPSASSHTTATSSAPISTPSPPNVPSLSRKRGDEATPAAKRLGLSSHDEEGEDAEGDVLDTPGREKKWEDAAATPGRMKRTRSAGSKGGVNLTLRDQEKVSATGPYSVPQAVSLVIHLSVPQTYGSRYGLLRRSSTISSAAICSIVQWRTLLLTSPPCLLFSFLSSTHSSLTVHASDILHSILTTSRRRILTSS